MEFITDRVEFAKAVNFGKYAVVSLDVDDETKQICYDKKEGIVGFTKVKVRLPLNETLTKFARVEMKWFKDQKQISFETYGSCVSSQLFYEDIMEEVEYANSPIIKPNEDFILVLHSSKTGKVMAIKLRAKTTSNDYCFVVEEKIDLLSLAYNLK